MSWFIPKLVLTIPCTLLGIMLYIFRTNTMDVLLSVMAIVLGLGYTWIAFQEK